MKAKILKKFKDKNTGRIYIPGEEVEFTEERVKEILESTKLIEVQEETEEVTTEEMMAEKTEEVSGKKKRSKKEEQ